MIETSITGLIEFIKKMPEQEINKSMLLDMKAFYEMKLIIESKEYERVDSGPVALAQGTTEFIREIKTEISWPHFQHIYTMFMLFLQHIIDEENDVEVLRTGSMDLYCEYVNPFVQL